MTASQAAQRIGCTKQSVLRFIRDGQLKANRVRIPGGFYWEVTEEELQRFLALPPPSKGRPRGATSA